MSSVESLPKYTHCKLERETFKPKQLPDAINSAIENGQTITDQRLTAEKCVSIVLRTGQKTYIKSDLLELMNNKAKEFIIKYNGYIPTKEYERLLFASRSQEILEYNDFVQIQKTIKSFQDASLRLFPQALHSVIEDKKECFPGIEFPILWATGCIRARQIDMRFQPPSTAKRDAIYKNINVNIIKSFQEIAFTPEGTLDPQLCNDVIHEISRQWEFANDTNKQGVLNKFRETFLPHIEKVCREQRTEPYKSWSGSADDAQNVFQEPLWYLSYDMAARKKIALTFVQQFQFKEAKIDETNIFIKLCALFPELKENIPSGNLVFWYNKTLIENALAQNKFSWLYPRILEDPEYAMYVQQAIQHLQEQLSREGDQIVFGDIEAMLLKVGFPAQGLNNYKEIREVISAIRIQRLEKMNDEQFWETVQKHRSAWQRMRDPSVYNYAKEREETIPKHKKK